jgi:hypothetical protein
MSYIDQLSSNSRVIIGQMVSRAEQRVIPEEKLNEQIAVDMSRHLASVIKKSGKLQVNKEMQDNGELKCDAELFIFTREELTELIVSVEQNARQRDVESWKGMDWG